MSDTRKHEIWPSATGITDLEEGLAQPGPSLVQEVRKFWAKQQPRMTEEGGTLSVFQGRMWREWCIETGVIERVYHIDQAATEALVEHGFQEGLLPPGSTDRPPGEVLQVLRDHAEVLEDVLAAAKAGRELTTSYIKALHFGIVRNQPGASARDQHGNLVEIPLIKGDWKVHPNYPTRDGVIHTFCPPEQVVGEMERLVEMHQSHIRRGVPAHVQAAWLQHRFVQIHPFQDGNGRVSRAIATLALAKAGLFPMTVTRRDWNGYIDALEAADGGDLRPLADFTAEGQLEHLRRAAALFDEHQRKGDG